MPDTPTARLSLYKSASDGSEDVDYTQDLGDNLDKIDLAVGALAVTTSTFPSAPWNGQLVRDTSTDRLWVSNGTSPASGSWSEICTPGTDQAFTGDVGVAGDLAVNGTVAATGDVTFTGDLTAGNLSVVLDWTTPAIATGYTANGNNQGTPQYRVINMFGTNMVQWRGGLAVTYSGDSPANSGMPFTDDIDTLATPTTTRTVPCACSASSSTSLSLKVDFTTDSTVIIVNQTGDDPPWVSLNGIMYSV